jgi:hypothetical protein
MYCSKCGAEISNNQAFCSRCGHTTANATGTMAAEAVEQFRYERTIRRLSRYWYFFAGLNVVLGAMGLFAIQTGLSMHAGPWEPWPHPYMWTDWGGPVTLIAAGLAFLEFPIGFALAIYTFTVLFGRHHALLFARMGEHEPPIGVR